MKFEWPTEERFEYVKPTDKEQAQFMEAMAKDIKVYSLFGRFIAIGRKK